MELRSHDMSKLVLCLCVCVCVHYAEAEGVVEFRCVVGFELRLGAW